MSCYPVLEYRSAIDRTRGAQRGDEDLDHVAAPSRSRPHGSIVRIEPAETAFGRMLLDSLPLAGIVVLLPRLEAPSTSMSWPLLWDRLVIFASRSQVMCSVA